MPSATAGDKPRVFRFAAILSAAISLSRLTGLVREMVMAHLFGASTVNDAFQLGFRIPSLSRNLFAEGALSSAFVPVFTQYLSTKGKREASELSQLVATALILVVGTLCAAGMIFSPQLVRLLAPGFEQVPGKFELTVLLTRIMFPFLLLVALAAQAMGILNSIDQYGIPALSSACFNLGSVIFGVLAGFTLGRHSGRGPIVSMAFGVLVGGALQLAWQLPSLIRAGFVPRLRLGFRHPGLQQIFRLMLPALLGSAALQINVLVNTNLASSLRDSSGHVMDGPVSWLGYAFRFMQLPQGVFGVAIASATLPAISRSAALGRLDEFRTTLANSLGMLLLLTIPSSVGLAVLGESMISVIYQWGRFQPADTHQTALALAAYSFGLAGYSAVRLLAPAFYALDDAVSPMIVSISSIAINFAVAFTLVTRTTLGHAGLALSTSIVALSSALLLFRLLSSRIHGLHARRVAISALKITAAALVMGACCHFSSLAVHRFFGVRKLAQFADVALSIPLGIAVFYALARAFGVEELEAVRTACYTSFRNAPRLEVGDPPAGN